MRFLAFILDVLSKNRLDLECIVGQGRDCRFNPQLICKVQGLSY